MIGFKASWERLIARHGYQLVDGRLFRISALPPEEGGPQIDRHKTALVRHELSAPMKMLARHGYLNGDYALFDYGCGRGDDLRELEAHGIDALGWDPNFRPDGEKVVSHLVNLGFVINVIEDQDERMEALLGARELTQTLWSSRPCWPTTALLPSSPLIKMASSPRATPFSATTTKASSSTT